MSGFYSYSPWRDAANFGQGVGSALSQALIQRPEINAQAALMRQKLSSQQQEEPLNLELLKAQIANQNFRPEYMGQMLQQRQEMLDNKNQQASEMLGLKKEGLDQQEKFGASLSALRDAQTKLTEDKAAGGGSNPFANVATKLSLLKGREQELAGGSGVVPQVPISPSSDLRSLVLQAKSPEEVQQILELSKLNPNTVTNDVSSWMGLKHTPNVTTNSYTMGIGDDDLAAFGVTHTGKVPNASLPKPGGEGNTNAQPEAPKGMIRVKSPEGKTGMIPADQLNDALQQGYQKLQ